MNIGVMIELMCCILSYVISMLFMILHALNMENLKQSKGYACETPLAKVFFFPGNSARKLVDGAVLMV
jgi:ABC-type Co2+ transport system permease subunit